MSKIKPAKVAAIRRPDGRAFTKRSERAPSTGGISLCAGVDAGAGDVGIAGTFWFGVFGCISCLLSGRNVVFIVGSVSVQAKVSVV